MINNNVCESILNSIKCSIGASGYIITMQTQLSHHKPMYWLITKSIVESDFYRKWLLHYMKFCILTSHLGNYFMNALQKTGSK